MNIWKEDLEMYKERLLSKRRITTSGCWEFTGSFRENGYGLFPIYRKIYSAHRVSMYLFRPDEYYDYLNVLHKCDNKKCFNPDHLYVGTQLDNMRDAVERGQWNNQYKDIEFCKRGHAFTKENTYYYGNKRLCKQCQFVNRMFRSS